MLWPVVIMIVLAWWMLSLMGNVSNLELLDDHSSLHRKIPDRHEDLEDLPSKRSEVLLFRRR